MLGTKLISFFVMISSINEPQELTKIIDTTDINNKSLIFKRRAMSFDIEIIMKIF